MRPEFVFRTPSALIVTAPATLGHLGVAVANKCVAGVSFGHASCPPAAARLARLIGEPLEASQLGDGSAVDERMAVDVLDRLVRYLEGEPMLLDDIRISLDHLTTFQRRVVAACRSIPFGATRSYGELAAASGSPGAARAVGQVMASNRAPLIVPCHRVLAAGGKLGGFSAPNGLAMKRRLLALEGAAPTVAAARAPRMRSNQRAFINFS
jgi:O-6-methylguanine DNA methyltransferase